MSKNSVFSAVERHLSANKKQTDPSYELLFEQAHVKFLVIYLKCQKVIDYLEQSLANTHFNLALSWHVGTPWMIKQLAQEESLCITDLTRDQSIFLQNRCNEIFFPDTNSVIRVNAADSYKIYILKQDILRCNLFSLDEAERNQGSSSFINKS